MNVVTAAIADPNGNRERPGTSEEAQPRNAGLQGELVAERGSILLENFMENSYHKNA